MSAPTSLADWQEIARTVDRDHLVCPVEALPVIADRPALAARFRFTPEDDEPVEVAVAADPTDPGRYIVAAANDYADHVKADDLAEAVAEWAEYAFRAAGVRLFGCDPCGKLAVDSHNIPASHPGGEGSACDRCAGVR